MSSFLAVRFGTYNIDSPAGFSFSGGTIADVSSEVLRYIFPFSGFLLLLFLISGGLDMMISAGDPKKIEQGKEKITAAIVGFLILFSGFWIYQIVAYIFGIKI